MLYDERANLQYRLAQMNCAVDAQNFISSLRSGGSKPHKQEALS